ncbi:hypothetical protein E5676_scaffold250G00680 [Cucumis melo var. makuwa]|uniref:Uncharacterized protein n=1 Tax=Cucumis melo var. makuwa TaxID=1194695 RepID=A0A5D3DKW7_CUCMM|nr:hypothetical protein E6C27_scaffold89G002170 [Cucumis melo var. makuwa]TYK24000.1 hypothetical protein E5676_scaffold250G00680 [Cucumis melo var. makuwa]
MSIYFSVDVESKWLVLESVSRGLKLEFLEFTLSLECGLRLWLVRLDFSSIKGFNEVRGVVLSGCSGATYSVGTVSYGITPRCVSFGSTRLICGSDGTTRVIYKSDGTTRLICVSLGVTRLLCWRGKVMYEEDRRGARRMREGHRRMSSLIASAN